MKRGTHFPRVAVTSGVRSGWETKVVVHCSHRTYLTAHVTTGLKVAFQQAVA